MTIRNTQLFTYKPNVELMIKQYWIKDLTLNIKAHIYSFLVKF